MKRTILGFGVLVTAILMGFPSGSMRSAQAAQASFVVIAESGTCNCCEPLNVTATVDPSNGNWTVQVTQGQPAVPVSVTVVSASEQTTTTTQANPNATAHSSTGNASAPATNPAPGAQTGTGGAISGTSSAVATGQGNDQGDSAPTGYDIDSSTKFVITVKVDCPAGTNCGSGDCVYKIKFTAASDEGFTVTRTP